MGLSTENVVIELSGLETTRSHPLQFDNPAAPDRTEPPTVQGPLGQLSPSIGAWSNHTKDLNELNQASKDLLVEVIAAKEAVRRFSVL
jgi:hypothetical protein